MSTDDVWRWHAYQWAFRVALELGLEGQHATPLDPAGEWWSRELAAKALAYWRRKLGKREAARFPPATSEAAVRTCAGKIPWRQLTAAEQAELRPGFLALAEAAKRALAAMGYRTRKALGGGDPGKAGAKAAHAVPDLGGHAVERGDLPRWK